jgi:hypothetical protein
VQDVIVTRTPLGSDLDQLVITVDVGDAVVDTWDGAFEPVSGVFNQNNSHSFGSPNAFPPKAAFDMGAVPADDTTYLITAIKAPDATVPSGEADSTSLLAGTASFTDASLFTGMIDFAQLVVASGADVATAVSTVAGSLSVAEGLAGPIYYIINDGFVTGSITGSTATAGGDLTGDYNDDGVVNAADYVVWRNNENTANVLPNDEIGGTIGQDHYDQWANNFGDGLGSGSGQLSAAVPEPSVVQLLSCLFVTLLGTHRRFYSTI